MKGCGRKGIRHEHFAPNQFDMADTNLEPAYIGEDGMRIGVVIILNDVMERGVPSVK